jgi:hypothetical protein
MATKPDIAKLDKKITALSKALANLGKGTDGKELLLIIRKPGWTTIAELALVNLAVDAAAQQVNQLQGLMGGLRVAAGKVAQQGVAGATMKRARAAKTAKKA